MCMVSSLNRCPPERHDAVTHVFVDSAPIAANDAGQPREHAGEQMLQLQRFHLFRHFGEAPHVTKHDR